MYMGLCIPAHIYVYKVDNIQEISCKTLTILKYTFYHLPHNTLQSLENKVSFSHVNCLCTLQLYVNTGKIH